MNGIDLSVKIKGVTFRNPITPGSSDISYDDIGVRKSIENGIGGIVTKSFTSHPPLRTRARPYHFNYRIFGKGFYSNFISRGGFHPMEPERAAETLVPKMAKLCQDAGIPLVVSIADTDNVEEWVTDAKRFVEAGANMLQLNFSCPHAASETDKAIGRALGFNLELTSEIIRAIKKAVDVPIGPKLSITINPYDHFVKGWKEAGADFIICHNTPTGMLIDVEQEVPFGGLGSGGYLMGPSTLPMNLGKTIETRKLTDLPIAASGGVWQGTDAIMYFLIGCHLVEVTSAVFKYGYRMYAEIIKGIEEWMERKGYSSIEDFRGKAFNLATRSSSAEIMYMEWPFSMPQEKTSPVVPMIDTDKCLFSSEKALPPCQAACPAGIDIRGYVNLISQGKFKEALALIRQRIPLPAVIGRVCTHPCETECNRGKLDEPIAINALKRFLADHELSMGKEEIVPGPQTKEEKVAVIGSGPAGLTAAHDLVKMGYGVTIFEAASVAGGMMSMSIPDYRLPRNIPQTEIETIQKMGVEIKLNSPAGKDGLTLDDIWQKGYKAIFIAVGAHKSLKLNLPGEDLEGVYDGLSFLKAVKMGGKVKVGSKVAIIGGGNVAIDAARTALRLGTKEVSILYRRTRDEMPVLKEEIEKAEEEGIKIDYLVAPLRILSQNGKVSGTECARMELEWIDASGRMRPKPINGPEFVVDVDTVIAAIGETPNFAFLGNESKFNITPKGILEVDPTSLATSVPGVFAGGDAVSGPATAIEAIAAGKRAAMFIDRYLSGESLVYKGKQLRTISFDEIETETVRSKSRAVVPALTVAERVIGFQEVEQSLTEKTAQEEAARCLSCGLCAKCQHFCLSSVFAPDEINNVINIDYENKCWGCADCVGWCPGNAISLIDRETKEVVWDNRGLAKPYRPESWKHG
ncbi:NAD(P)-binding protein [Chloroflexota bacterium]